MVQILAGKGLFQAGDQPEKEAFYHYYAAAERDRGITHGACIDGRGRGCDDTVAQDERRPHPMAAGNGPRQHRGAGGGRKIISQRRYQPLPGRQGKVPGTDVAVDK